MEPDLAIWLATAFVLFATGLYGLVSKRDALRLVIAIELMVVAGNMVLIGFGFLADDNPLAETYTILSLAVGGAVIGLALTFLGKIYETRGSIDVSKFKELKW